MKRARFGAQRFYRKPEESQLSWSFVYSSITYFFFVFKQRTFTLISIQIGKNKLLTFTVNGLVMQIDLFLGSF